MNLGKNELVIMAKHVAQSPVTHDIFVIGGDVLFQMSIGRTDLPGGDHQTLLDSIKRELFVLDDDFEVHPGHGPSTDIGFEKRNNPFLQF